MSNFWKDAQNAFDNLKNRTNTAIESGKLNFEVSQLRNRITAVYKEIGQHVYQQAGKEDNAAISTNEGFIAEKINEIKFYEKKIAEIKKQNEDLYRQQQKAQQEKEAAEQKEKTTDATGQPEEKPSEDAGKDAKGQAGTEEEKGNGAK